MVTQSMISARTVGASSFVPRRPAVVQRVARSTPKRVVGVSAAFPGAQAAKYMSEAFTQIFTTPEDDRCGHLCLGFERLLPNCVRDRMICT